MTGIVQEVRGVKRTHCLIHTTTEDFFAHQSDFVDPETMVEGMEVECRLKLAQRGGKHREVTDVVAIQRKAA